VKELSQQGKTQRQIAVELSISVGAVNKYLKL
jgi:DNA-binding CsgD family transcriptional regulator